MADDGTVADLVMHPVRLRVIEALSGRTLTTRQLREALPDVAQATLYRHVAALVEAGFLAVAGERPVRGTVERRYRLGERLAHVDQRELEAMDAAQLRSAFVVFLRKLAADFDRLVDRDDVSDRDFLGFGQTVVHLGPDDPARLQSAFADLLTPYLDPAPGRRRVVLNTALIPQKEP